MFFFRSKVDVDFFSAPPNLNFLFYLKNAVHHEECTFFIESLVTLKRLLAEKRLRKEDPVLRFLVDDKGLAWFARETRPGVKAPKHFQMTGASQDNASCATAGNIKFTSRKCSVLKNLNHRSGDFQPSFHSLRLFIAILVLNEELLPFKLPKKLVVKELDGNGDMIYKHRWPLVHVKEWVQSFSHDLELIHSLKQHDAARKKVHYKSTLDTFCTPELSFAELT